MKYSLSFVHAIYFTSHLPHEMNSYLPCSVAVHNTENLCFRSLLKYLLRKYPNSFQQHGGCFILSMLYILECSWCVGPRARPRLYGKLLIQIHLVLNQPFSHLTLSLFFSGSCLVEALQPCTVVKHVAKLSFSLHMYYNYEGFPTHSHTQIPSRLYFFKSEISHYLRMEASSSSE